MKECFIPALFATGEQDDFIKPHHTQSLHDAYAGDKNLIKFEGDHNSSRPEFFLNSAVIFFTNTLQVEALLTPDNMLSPEEKKQMKQKQIERREAWAKAKQEKKGEVKEDGKSKSAAAASHMPAEEPATGLEAMMGLDNMGDIHIPDGFLDPGYRGLG